MHLYVDRHAPDEKADRFQFMPVDDFFAFAPVDELHQKAIREMVRLLKETFG